MASPFTVFRKYQKVLLAITGILAMIAFVFLGTCIQTTGVGRSYNNPLVVSWKYGELRETDLASMVQLRVSLNDFLRTARLQAGLPDTREQVLATSEESVIHTMVLAQRARDAGVVVSDDMINQVLARHTDNRLSGNDFMRLLASYKPGNQRVTPQQLFDVLREHLLAERALHLFAFALAPTTPDQRWDYFNRLERRVTAQVLPLPVVEFTDDVKTPSDTVLQEFFDKHKNRLAVPDSPEPGFRQPYRAKFQYFKADVEELTTEEMPNVTDAEIEEYYEKNKNVLFRERPLPPLEEKTEDKSEATKEEKSDAEKSAAEKSDAVKAETEKSDDRKAGGNAGETDKNGDKAAAKPDVNAKEQDAKSNEHAKAKGKSAPAPEKPAESANEKDDGKGEKQQSSQTRDRNTANPFRFVNYQDEKAAGDRSKADSSKEEVKTESQVKETRAKEKEKEAEAEADKSDTSKADVAAKDETAKEDAAKSDAAKSDEAPSTEKSETAKSKPIVEPVVYRPLEKVRDEIRRSLARERVPARVDKIFDELRGQLRAYVDARGRWLVNKTKNPDEAEPRKPDFEKLAAKYPGIKAYTTALISQSQAATDPTLDIARSFNPSMNLQNPFAREDWLVVAFQEGQLFRQATSRDPEENRYLWWKIDEAAPQVPEFADVRDEVLETWKMIQARAAAQKAAEDYARQVRAAKGTTMKEIFADDANLPVKEVGPFAWLTGGNVPFAMQQLPPRISEVPGVDKPGDEFMRTAYRLEPNEVGVAFNEPKTMVYVLQVTGTDPSEEILQREFMVKIKNFDRYQQAASNTQYQAQRNWMQSLNEQYGVHWERPAQAPSPMQM